MENNLVYKSNRLVEARYNLSLNEQKIILYAVSKLNRDSDKFNMISVEVKEFTRLIGSTEDRYTEIREIVRELRKKEVVISTGESELITGWLASIEYMKDSGTVELEFSDKLAPYLLQLKETYTKYQLKNVLHLRNKYSIRIYELLKQYEGMRNRSYREFGIEELRNYLGIAEEEYSRFTNFEARVLKVAVKEISENTDIKASYKKIKEGRKIAKIRFDVSYSEREYIEYLESIYPIDEFKEKAGLSRENWSSKQIADIYDTAVDKAGNEDVDIFEYIKLNYEKTLQNKAVRNRCAYLKKALAEDYAKAILQLKLNYRVESQEGQ